MKCIKGLIIYVLCMAFLSESYASQRSDRLHFFIDQIDFGGEIEYFSEAATTQRDNALITRLQGRLHHPFNSYSYLNTEARFSFLTRGTTQNNFLIPERQRSGFDPLSIYIGLIPQKENLEFLPQKLKPLNPQLRIGVINQNFLQAPLLISDWGFIGIQQEFSLSSLAQRYVDELQIVFQQTMPSSVVENINVQEQIQEQAYFFTGSAFFKHNYKDMIFTRGNFTGFHFLNPSSEVARSGGSLGNIIENNRVGGDSRFIYDPETPFYGGHLGVNTYIYLYDQLDVEFGFSFLWNVAEFRKLTNYERYLETIFSDESKSYSFLLKTHIPLDTLFQGVKLIPNYEYFVSAPQGSPAYYNSYRYGHSNREGHIIGFEFLINKEYFLNIEYRILRRIGGSQDSINNSNHISFTFGRGYDGQI